MFLKTFKHIIKNYYEFVLFLLLGIWLFLNISPVISQNIPEEITVNRAIKLIDEAEQLYSQNNQYIQAAEKLQQAIHILNKTDKLGPLQKENLAVSYTNLGTLKLLLGQPNDALENWQEATSIYKQLNNPTEVSNSLILEAKALDRLSLYPRACNTLTLALAINKEQKSCEIIKFTGETIKQVPQNFLNDSQSNYLQGLIILGNVLRKIGKLDQSEIVLEETLELTKKGKFLQPATYFALGDTLKAKGDLDYQRQSTTKYDYQPWYFEPRNLDKLEQTQQYYQDAVEKYHKASNLASSKEVLIKSQLKSLNLWLILGDIDQAQKLASNINLADLSKTVANVYTKINYAKSLAYLQQKEGESSQIYQPNEIINLLKEAIDDAQNLKNQYCSLKTTDVEKQRKTGLNLIPSNCLKYNRAESYALGNLGGLYEYLGDLKLAKQYTQEAFYLAQPSEAPDLAYQWQWQLGRLFKAEGKTKEAIASYKNAVETLASVRSDLLAIDADVQFNFRDNVEPIYRKLIDLLLKKETNISEQDEFLWESIYYLDSLQIAELENFLSCDLRSTEITEIKEDNFQKEPIEALKKRIKQISASNPNAAFIYPIILQDRLEVIYKLPGEKWQHHSNDVSHNIVKETLRKLRDEGLLQGDSSYIIENAKSLYQWLIKPLELQKTNKVNTLVFILDGELRNIPMAVLYDQIDNQYLVEKEYALVVLPSANLFDLTSLQKQTQVLAGGISERVKVEGEGLEFEPLSVNQELQTISQEPLINEKFTQESLREQINSGKFSIVHLATHGNFSSDPQQTYILVYGAQKATGKLLTYNELEQLLGQSNQKRNKTIDLLVLSACKTAEGDNRATLGLAGLAVKAGTNSTLATLWQVGDQATVEFMKKFYSELAKGTSKAEAVQKAQKQLLADPSYQNPRDWAAYILVGNWR